MTSKERLFRAAIGVDVAWMIAYSLFGSVHIRGWTGIAAICWSVTAGMAVAGICAFGRRPALVTLVHVLAAAQIVLLLVWMVPLLASR
jgi:hypothetical protein